MLVVVQCLRFLCEATSQTMFVLTFQPNYSQPACEQPKCSNVEWLDKVKTNRALSISPRFKQNQWGAGQRPSPCVGNMLSFSSHLSFAVCAPVCCSFKNIAGKNWKVIVVPIWQDQLGFQLEHRFWMYFDGNLQPMSVYLYILAGSNCGLRPLCSATMVVDYVPRVSLCLMRWGTKCVCVCVCWCYLQWRSRAR